MKHNPRVDAAKLFALWHGQLPNLDVAKSLNISVYQLWVLGKRYGLPNRVHLMSAKKRGRKPETDVVGKEYERRKAEVRAKWSDEEREKRRVGPSARPWTMPAYAYDGRVCAFVKAALD
jgi:hypothetical protein